MKNSAYLFTNTYVYIYIYIYIDIVAFWLVNACNIKLRTNRDMRGNRDIFSGKSKYNRETISRQEHRISEYRIKI